MKSTISSEGTFSSFEPPTYTRLDNKIVESSVRYQISTDKPILSLVIPIYNDGHLAQDFVNTTQDVLKGYLNTEKLDDLIEIIFVDDGSSNGCSKLLYELAAKYYFVKVIELSRNFGQHIALSCGYKYSQGDLVGVFDVDMQDPPSELPKLINHLRESGCDVIQGIRRERKDDAFKRLSSKGFGWVFSRLTGFKMPTNLSTLRIMNRAYIDAFNRYTETVRFIPGMEYWLGFKRTFVQVEHLERKTGASSYNFYKRLSLAINGMISFSDLPLKVNIAIGLLLSVMGIALSAIYIALKISRQDILPGFTSIICVLLFSQGMVLSMLGITGLYIGRILKEVQNRPLYVVRNTSNIQNQG